MSDQEDLTAEPSARRIQLAREMGFIPLAPALVRSIVLGISLLLVFSRSQALVRGLLEIIRRHWANLPVVSSTVPSTAGVMQAIVEDMGSIAEPVLVICAGTVVAAVATHQLTTGGSWTPTLALPKVERLWAFWARFDEEAGSSKPALHLRMIQGVLRPLAALAGCALVVVLLRWNWTDQALASGEWSQAILKEHLGLGRESLGLSLCMLTMPLLCLGGVELWIARQHWFNRLRPTSEQARKELEEVEGSPELKRQRQKLSRQIREAGALERLLEQTEIVVVGQSMAGLCVQITKLKTGKLAVGEVVRGSLSARYAEKAASLGRPWLRDAKLARRVAAMADVKMHQPQELPTVLAMDLQRKVMEMRNKASAGRLSA